MKTRVAGAVRWTLALGVALAMAYGSAAAVSGGPVSGCTYSAGACNDAGCRLSCPTGKIGVCKVYISYPPQQEGCYCECTVVE